MNLYRIALAAATFLAPAAANATVYQLEAAVDSRPAQNFGTIAIDPTIVADGALRLERTCEQFGPCRQSGPWNQVSFDLTNGLQAGVTGTGPGAIADLTLLFGDDGDVTGGTIKLEVEEAHPGVAFLSASLRGEPGPCPTGTLCGTYIPVEFAQAVPISLMFVQQTATVARAVPEPEIGLAGFLAAFLGILGGGKVLRRA